MEGNFVSGLKNSYEISFDVDFEMKKKSFWGSSLFISERQDVCVGYKDLLNLIEDYPRATVAVLDIAGHTLQIEQQEVFEELVENWFKRVEMK